MDACVGLTIPVTTSQSRCTTQNGQSLFSWRSLRELSNGDNKSSDPAVPPPRLLSCNCSSDIGSNFDAFSTVMSWLHQHLSDANMEHNYTEYLDLMKLEVDQQLNKVKEGMRVLKSYNFPHDGGANGSCPMICQHEKLTEIDEGFNELKVLLILVFRQIRQMLSLFNASIHDLKWEHEIQLEVTGIMIGDCIRVLHDELERKLYEQRSIVNDLRRNWKETVVKCGAIREELTAIYNMLLPSEEESHIFHSKHENLGNRNNRWKHNVFENKTGEGHYSSSGVENRNSATQRSISPSEVISENSDFRHLKGMTREEMINYFRSEISKLKRLHELYLQDKTEELFKFKREKGSLALKYGIEFESFRKKFPEIISRVDQIISNTMKAAAVCSTSETFDEISRLNNRIDSLYRDNQHLRGLLEEKKDTKELSCQISDASRKMSLRLPLEEALMRQVGTIKGEYEDLFVESTIRDELNHTVTRKLVDDCRNHVEDAALNFQAKVSSLEARLLEKEKALCLADEENQKLKEKLSVLEKEQFIQNNREDPELIKEENEEMILRDIEMEHHVSPRNSYKICEHNMQDDELLKLSQTLAIASTALKEVETKKLDYNDLLVTDEQESQLDCIILSIMDLSKEFAEIGQLMSGDNKGSEERPDKLSDQCNHVVQQTIVLTKKGLSYKQMLDTRRSELRKAEAEVDILGNKVNALLSLVQKIYVTLERYSPVFQRYPGLLDAFLKTCKLVAGLRTKQKDDLQDRT